MPTPYTPVATWDEEIQLPSDGDKPNVSSVNPAFEALADRTEYLLQRPRTHRFKATDQTLAGSSTLTLDASLKDIPVEAALYALDMRLMLNADDTMDFKFQLVVPQISGNKALGKIQLQEITQNSILNLDGTGWDDVQSLALAGAGSIVVRANGIFTFAAAGEVDLMWAQDTADAATLTVYAGSYLKLDRIEV